MKNLLLFVLLLPLVACGDDVDEHEVDTDVLCTQLEAKGCDDVGERDFSNCRALFAEGRPAAHAQGCGEETEAWLRCVMQQLDAIDRCNDGGVSVFRACGEIEDRYERCASTAAQAD